MPNKNHIIIVFGTSTIMLAGSLFYYYYSKKINSDFPQPNDISSINPKQLPKAPSEQYKCKNIKNPKEEKLIKAIFKHSLAINISPNEKEHYANRSMAFIENKNYKSALTDAEMIISIDSLYTKGHYLKGLSLMKMRKFHEAKKSFAVVLSLAPQNASSQVLMNECDQRLSTAEVSMNPVVFVKELDEFYQNYRQASLSLPQGFEKKAKKIEIQETALGEVGEEDLEEEIKKESNTEITEESNEEQKEVKTEKKDVRNEEKKEETSDNKEENKEKANVKIEEKEEEKEEKKEVNNEEINQENKERTHQVKNEEEKEVNDKEKTKEATNNKETEQKTQLNNEEKNQEIVVEKTEENKGKINEEINQENKEVTQINNEERKEEKKMKIDAKENNSAETKKKQRPIDEELRGKKSTLHDDLELVIPSDDERNSSISSNDEALFWENLTVSSSDDADIPERELKIENCGNSNMLSDLLTLNTDDKILKDYELVNKSSFRMNRSYAEKMAKDAKVNNIVFKNCENRSVRSDFSKTAQNWKKQLDSGETRVFGE